MSYITAIITSESRNIRPYKRDKANGAPIKKEINNCNMNRNRKVNGPVVEICKGKRSMNEWEHQNKSTCLGMSALGKLIRKYIDRQVGRHVMSGTALSKLQGLLSVCPSALGH